VGQFEFVKKGTVSTMPESWTSLAVSTAEVVTSGAEAPKTPSQFGMAEAMPLRHFKLTH
jgi:hypothetical protein